MLYSYLVAIPLLVTYEILIIVSQPASDQIIRISIDIWIKSIFQTLGVNAISATLLTAAFIGAVIIYTKRSELPHLQKKYFGLMVMEAAVYAVLVTVVIVGFLNTLLNMFADGLQSLHKIQLFALSLGAGLYEELFFRVLLVGGLSLLFKKVFKKKGIAFSLAVVVAALIFSGVHYIGEFGDVLTFGSFLFRFLFGLALNVIYVTRGFGITAWTHAIYDIIVILQM